MRFAPPDPTLPHPCVLFAQVVSRNKSIAQSMHGALESQSDSIQRVHRGAQSASAATAKVTRRMLERG